MLTLFFGTDREAARKTLDASLKKEKGEIVRVTDAHSFEDLQAALQGPGMFARDAVRALVFDSVIGSGSPEANELLRAALPHLSEAPEHAYVLEGALDAATRKSIEKYATRSEQFDAPKKQEEKTIFVLANALQRGDKKGLWVGLMREYAKGSAPEAVLGLLFWGAKQMTLRSREGAPEYARGSRFVAELAELPHKARRRGEDLSYALERFALSSL
jgi:hypothetical protein